MLTHLTSLARRLAGLAALALLVAGVPWALLRYVSTPLPDQVPTWDQVIAALSSPLTDELLGTVLVAALWLAWAAFVWSVITELAAVLAGVRLPQPRAFAPARGLAALLVAAITGGVLATAAQAAPPALAAPSAAQAAVAITPGKVTTVPATRTNGIITNTATSSTAVPRAATAGELTLVAAGRTYTCTVEHGDTLSKLARTWLGDANRWPEIFALNRGTHFTSPGGTLTNPHLIRAGWTLVLPDDATPPPGAALQQPPTAMQDPAEPAALPDWTAPAPSASTASAAPAPSGTAASSAPTADVPATDDDGVVPTTSRAVSDAAPSTAPSAVDADRAGHTPAGVDLPGGSWLDLGLAGAVLAAVALVWAHRQRRHARRPLANSVEDADSDAEVMPPVVTHLRRGLRRQSARRAVSLRGGDAVDLAAYRGFFDTLQTDPGTEATGTDVTAFALWDAGTAEHETTDFDQDSHDDVPPIDAAESEDAEAFDDADEPARPHGAEGVDEAGVNDEIALRPVTPALHNPVAPLWSAAGLGLVGPGAAAAARGFLLAALAAGGVDEPDARSCVIMPTATLGGLLADAGTIVPCSPRLTTTGDLAEALALLEAQILHRTRVLYEHEVDTVAELREVDPAAEPLAPLVLIADQITAHQRARVASLLVQGQRLDVHGILLGAWPDGDTVTVAASGETHAAEAGGRHGAHPADVGRLAVLTADEATAVLRLLGESHTGDAPPPMPTTGVLDEPSSADPADGADPDDETTGASVSEPADAASDTASAAIHADVDGAPDSETDDGGRVVAEPAVSGDVVGAARTGRVRVEVLGRPRILDVPAGERLRPQAVELLVYLVARGGSAHQDDIFEDLIPDAPRSRAPHRLNTYAYNLRLICKLIAGDDTYLRLEQKRYSLNRDAFDLDLWQMYDAIAEAAAADDPHQRAKALHRAVGAYTGHLGDGRDYLWAESYREAVRHRHLDAVLILADTLTAAPLDDPRGALSVLTAAVEHHPYCEELTHSIMRIHAGLGEIEPIRAAHRDLARRLNDLDVEPSDATVDLADELVAKVQRRRQDETG